MSEPLPIWVEYFRALGVPILGAAAAFIAFLQYRLAKDRRSDELFDRRIALLDGTLEITDNPLPGELLNDSMELRLRSIFNRHVYYLIDPLPSNFKEE